VVLDDIHAAIRTCTLCALSRSRTHAVPGEGAADARVMFVGEAPGYHEDVQGRPFVGAAGKLLSDMLASIGLKRSEAYISNVVKCRPPQNRDPQPAEIETCTEEYLFAQIAAINPRIVCALGRFAMGVLLDPKMSIMRVHGTVHRKSGMLYLPMIHPAAALHKEPNRRLVEQDFQRLAAVLRGELPTDAS
jgi:uracil-DNA glycosylase family 4